jgi:hypothetical protein
MPSRYDVFVSYSHKDGQFVGKLVDRLVQSGISVFFDEADIAVGDSLAESLHRAVQDARYVLVVMSPDYFASQWAGREMELALQQEIETNRTKVIPLLVRDCEIPTLLRMKLYADFRHDDEFEKTYGRLLAALRETPVSPTRKSREEKLTPLRLGSMTAATSDSAELRQMVEGLRSRVEAFLEGSEAASGQAQRLQVDVDPKLCFVVMPFGPEELSDVYEYFVKPSIESNCNLRCERADDVFGSNVIMDDIRRSIERARVVVADLTGRNPNVFYEVGIAHTLNKDVLLLAQSMSDVPFDLRHRRVLVYECTPKGCKKLERSVADNVNGILRGGA